MTGSAPLLPPPFAKLAGRWRASLRYFGSAALRASEDPLTRTRGSGPIFGVSSRPPRACACSRGHGGGWGRPRLWQGSPAPPC